MTFNLSAAIFKHIFPFRNQEFRCLSRTVPQSATFIEVEYAINVMRGVIPWDSIVRAFPGALYVIKDGKIVAFERDEDMKEIVPRKIPAYPFDVLEVVVLEQESYYYQSRSNISVVHQESDHSAMAEPSQEGLDGTQSTINELQHSTNATPRPSEHLEKHQAYMATNLIANFLVGFSVAIARVDALQDALVAKQNQAISLQNELTKKQDHITELTKEMKNMQQQTLDRLAAIQRWLQLVLNRNYELFECPIPRFFIILPRDPHFRDHFNPFSVPFKLYFLCECGSHTMGKSTTIPHKIHIAKHEGYDVAQPTEFLKRYGSYILTVLQMIKYGTKLTAVVAPTLAVADISEQMELSPENIQNFGEHFKAFVEDAISILQSKMNPSELYESAEDQVESSKLELLDETDLSQLGSYLSSKDTTRTLGNLYRIVTNEVHAKWVCLDHYRENYKDEARKQLREIVESTKGDLNENEGKVTVILRSTSSASRFYDVFLTTRWIHELDIRLSWDANFFDLRELERVVRDSNISILRLDASAFNVSTSDTHSSYRQFDPLIEMMTNERLRIFELVECREFFNGFDRLPQGGNNSNLQSLQLISCNMSRPDHVGGFFKALPKVKHIRMVDWEENITFSRVETLSCSAGGRAFDTHLSVKNILRDNWEGCLDNWFGMEIVHFVTDMRTISGIGLNNVFSANQQLETLTIDIDSDCRLQPLLEQVNQYLRKYCHLLKVFTLNNSSLDTMVSVNYDHGRLLSGSLRGPQCKTIDLNYKSIRALSVWITGQTLTWEFNDHDARFRDDENILSMFFNTFSMLPIQEIHCDNIDDPCANTALSWLLERSNATMAKLSFAGSKGASIRLLRDNEMETESFPDLRHFTYHTPNPMHELNIFLGADEIERVISWLTKLLPDKSSNQIRPHKMAFELKNLNLEDSQWERLLNSVDFRSLYEFRLSKCVFSTEMLSVLETALAGADLDLIIGSMESISPETKSAYDVLFQASNLRIS